VMKQNHVLFVSVAKEILGFSAICVYIVLLLTR